jgi:hypothetical protein
LDRKLGRKVGVGHTVLHIATVHVRSPRWIPIQTRELRRHMSAPYRTWASLDDIDSTYRRYFDNVVDRNGDHGDNLKHSIDHANKLNLLAVEICREAGDGDLVMFLDGDAFPIADPWPLVESCLAKAPLLAVRRAENCDDPHPHPCFCVTRVATWQSLPGDWREGFVWAGPRNKPTTDVGANLLRRLQLSGTPWAQVLRSNKRNPHPLMFGVYGDAIYHHGAGFRYPLARVDVAHMDPQAPGHHLARREIMERNRQQSEAVFTRIQRDDPGWLAEFI